MYFIDTHCHLHDREFFTDTQATQMLKNAHARNIKQIICIGTNHADSLNAKAFAESHPNVFWTYGIHPEHASGEIVSSRRQHGGYDRVLRRDARNDGPSRPVSANELSTASERRLVAIGEVGLDYHYPGYNRTDQIRLLETMLQLALDFGLPCSFHVRDALPDFFAVVQNFSGLKPSVLHSFSDNKAHLNHALEQGFYIGINGLATFANLACYQDLTTDFLHRALLETDAPFLTPEPNRGKINEPGNVADVASWLAKKFAISVDQVAEWTTQNARTIFDLPDPEPAPSRPCRRARA